METERVNAIDKIASNTKLMKENENEKYFFGKRLKRAIASNGFHTEEFCERLGITKEAVSSYYRGVAYPTVKHLIDICRLLNVTPDYLLGFCEYSFKRDD